MADDQAHEALIKLAEEFDAQAAAYERTAAKQRRRKRSSKDEDSRNNI